MDGRIEFSSFREYNLSKGWVVPNFHTISAFETVRFIVDRIKIRFLKHLVWITKLQELQLHDRKSADETLHFNWLDFRQTKVDSRQIRG